MRRTWIALVLAASAACASGDATGPSFTSATVRDYSYSPASLSVKAGTVVRWSNLGSVAHTVTSDSAGLFGGSLAAPGGGGYGGSTPGGVYTRTFSDVGTFPYHCANHAGMHGTVTVTP